MIRAWISGKRGPQIIDLRIGNHHRGLIVQLLLYIQGNGGPERVRDMPQVAQIW